MHPIPRFLCRSQVELSDMSCYSGAVRTYIGDEYHPAIFHEVKVCLDLAVTGEGRSQAVCIRLKLRRD